MAQRARQEQPVRRVLAVVVVCAASQVQRVKRGLLAVEVVLVR